MKKLVVWIKNIYFNDSLDFRAQIFNSLGFLGCALSLILAVYSAINYTGMWSVFGNFSAAVAAIILVVSANRTGAFKTVFLISVIVVFIIIFPALFFSAGGYKSSMPCFFLFAIVFTVIMLEGHRRIFFTIFELLLYCGCILTAYFCPETVIYFDTEMNLAVDIIVGLLLSAVVLFIAINRHITVYDQKMKELEKANDALHGLNRMKTEFLQDIRHEIRNPLYIISLGTDFIHNSIETEGGKAETYNALANIQNEAIRLGRMINGMVDLAIMSEIPKSREKTDFAALLNKCAEASRLQAEQKRNTLRIEIAPGLPLVYAEPEQLERVPINLISNAVNSTRDGEIALEVFAGNGYITVRVRDTGEGIEPALLPRVFERGVSGKGGKGYGLPMCKTIVEAHGGIIEIDSEPGKGTTTTFTIPVYGGQNERG